MFVTGSKNRCVTGIPSLAWASRYDRPMPRRRARRRGTPKRTRRCADNLDAGQFDEPQWVWVGDQRMFVVGYTPGGVPFGCFEDELDNLR
jgi:hypothetical protein